MHVHMTCMRARVQGTSLYVGTVPRTAAHLAELHSLGVRAVVTLNQAWEPQVDGGVPKAAAAAGMHHLNAPTPDFAAPTQRHLRAAVDFMEEHVNAGHGVYVHCNGGRGRSVVCLLGFLVRSKGLTAHEAYALVAQHRRVRVRVKVRARVRVNVRDRVRARARGEGRVTVSVRVGVWVWVGVIIVPTRQTAHKADGPSGPPAPASSARASRLVNAADSAAVAPVSRNL